MYSRALYAAVCLWKIGDITTVERKKKKNVTKLEGKKKMYQNQIFREKRSQTAYGRFLGIVELYT